jgi:hypothetical protein
MDKEESAGEGKVAVTCRTYKDDDPLPFLKKSSSRSGSGADFDSRPTIAARKRHAPSGPMDEMFQQRLWDEIVLAIGFFFYLNSFHLKLHSLLYLLICVEL